jgi:hypothetical protein
VNIKIAWTDEDIQRHQGILKEMMDWDYKPNFIPIEDIDADCDKLLSAMKTADPQLQLNRELIESRWVFAAKAYVEEVCKIPVPKPAKEYVPPETNDLFRLDRTPYGTFWRAN